MPKRVGFALVLLSMMTSCHKGAAIPSPGSKPYADLVSAFYVGLAGLQAGEDVRAKQGLTLASTLAPGEPATWANLGLLELRQQQYDQAFQHVETARSLAPQNSHVQALLGLIESKRGNLTEAIRHLREAVALDPGNVKALYALAQETEREGSQESDSESRKLLGNILRTQPNNQVVLLDSMRLAAKLGDRTAVNGSLAALENISHSWPVPARKQLDAIKAAATGNVRAAAVQVQFLRNLLVRDVGFRRDLDAIRPPAGTLGEPFSRFLRIGSPSSHPAASDTSLLFVPRNASEPYAGKIVTWAGSFVLDAKSSPRVVWTDRNGLHLDQGTTLALPGSASVGPSSITFGDLNYDFKTDVVMATEDGLRIYQQGVAPLFADVTAKTKLDASVLKRSYTGAWLFDADLDGDLDIVLGTRVGDPLVLRNNGDGTFAVLYPFAGVNGVKDFAAADLDGDGVPDAAFLDSTGKLRVFTNERLSNYRLRNGSVDRKLAAITTGDISGQGLMDLIVLTADGIVMRVSGNHTSELVRLPPGEAPLGSLLLGDLDNNGSLDLVIGKHVFLHDAQGFTSHTQSLGGTCKALLDIDLAGRLDAVALDSAGKLSDFKSSGTKQYRWQTLRTRASQTSGDQRINSYGIGGEVEVRSGLLTQKQSITSPVLHFGLGDNTAVSLARIVWPNGQLQVEFDLRPDATALAQQRLKGSCPFLFAWDGKRMGFVKDCAPWSPALGLHINAQQVAGIGQTQEWFKIPGDRVVARDGFYDLRITAEYWETFYIDHYSFLAVDHAPGTDIFADERFAVPSPPLKLYEVSGTRPFAMARDDRGTDVSNVVRTIDAQYLDTFGRGRYQGVTRDHWVELELPSEAPNSGPLYLVGSGWLHPTDATINVALGQSTEPPPQGLTIEVVGANGKWHTAKAGLGFPAGRLKNVVLDLQGIFSPGAPRILRLRTNLEIYWDRLAWATGADKRNFTTQQLSVSEARLEYRGFSRIFQANESSPELPDYGAVEKRGPQWRDLEGYYTRYGDVRPLLQAIDDRLLITNAGDELQLKVTAPPPPRAGWTRDLIMIGDGWIKDGDFNSVFSKTVLPLPYHGLRDYTVDSKSLEEDLGYRLHPDDWKVFHTRYISPDLFSRALWH